MQTSPPTVENPRIFLKSCPHGSRIREAVPLLAERGSADGRRRNADISVRRKQHTRTSGGIGIRVLLEIAWQHRVGSSPVWCTKRKQMVSPSRKGNAETVFVSPPR